ncbi:hypothetical protein EUGRSUZ_K00982 [Eucalyptus grandis]|uniref:Uncharacterized protein n=2 Tax=Eucalyptus grandis TaxID=71139 RepID=A0ACC3ISE8_EUCGR|nr:hypothetical protein EUGRSUZ_K00982 [Eucalyptus grandis]
MDRDLYEATKEGDANKFVDGLEKVSRSRKLDLQLIFYQVTPFGNSLLHVAASDDDDDASSGNDDVVELILKYFPDMVTNKNSSEDTPLHVAIRDQRFKAAEMLIDPGTVSEIIYWKNKDGKSPLYLAVEGCKWQRHEGVHWEIFQLLLNAYAGDEAYEVKIQGMSPVSAGLMSPVSDRFLPPAVAKLQIQGMPPRILAELQKVDKDLVEAIIDRLPKLLHVRDEKWGTPLHAAASVGNRDVVNLLLDKCPDLALQTDKGGSYPIHILCQAFEGRNPSVITDLIKGTWSKLADIKNKEGQNIVHVAAKAGKDLAVSWICAWCDGDIAWKLVNSKDDNGNTPLHLASKHVHCEVMRILTNDESVDLRLRNNDGLTALDVFMESRSMSTRSSALLGRAILIVAGVPRSEGRDDLSPREQGSGVSKSSPTEWIKDQVNTLLLVATLVASVTFTAGLTLPGGYNASDDPHPGMATMLHHGMFQVFVIANTVAMYSSVLAVVVLLWGFDRDYDIAKLAHHSAGPLLLMALTGMSVAFFVAITVAVSKLSWLGSLVWYIGIPYLVMVMVVLAALIFPSSKTIMRIVIFYYKAVSVYKICSNYVDKIKAPPTPRRIAERERFLQGFKSCFSREH